MEKLFVNYSKSKQEFINSGLREIYANKIVFIGNGECIFTKGKFFANEQELIALISNLIEQERQARTEVVNTKVDKVEGKLLSLEDFTTFFKNKLDGLNNYDDTELSNKINSLRNDLDTLVKGDTSEAIETFNEIIAFLEEIEDKENLLSLLVTIESKIPTLLSLLQEDTEHRLVTDAEKAIWNNSYLPLTGGLINGTLTVKSNIDTPLTIKGTVSSWIKFMNKGDQDLGWIGIESKHPYFYSSPTSGYKIWHEGNDGEGSGLDADTLDGKHLHEFFDIVKNPKTQIDLYHLSVDKAAAISWDSATSNNVLNKPDFVGASLFHFPGEKGWQFCKPYNKLELLFRDRYDNNWFDWKTIAFTDYNGFYDLYGGKEIPANSDLNDYKTIGTYSVATNIVAQTISNCPISISFTLHVLNPVAGNHYIRQELTNGSTAERYYRTYTASSSTWSDWKAVNSLTSTKLATPVKLWGNDFDGSGDIPVTSIGQMQYLNFTGTDLETSIGYIGRGSSTNNDIYIGTHSKDASIRLFAASDPDKNIILRNTGFVGIGISNPVYKLDIISSANNVINISSTVSSNEASIRYVGADNKLWTAGKGVGSTLDAFGFWSNTLLNNVMTLKSNGNVGIGTIDPLYKLEVNGTGRIENLVFNNNNEINGYALDTQSFTGNVHINFNSTGNVTLAAGGGNVGIGTNYSPQYKLEVNGATHIKHGDINTTFQGNLIISHNTRNKSGFFIYPGANPDNALSIDTTNENGSNLTDSVRISKLGNVGIKVNHPQYTLDVNGSAAISDYTIFKDSVSIWNSLAVSNKIASGDLVDWYGVSWSEDSSDPTCTRIGNMALHRSLPILSAMKGYYIGNIQSACPECMLPLNDDWSKLHYNMTDNGEVTVTSFVSGNIMVKIPEFWYIDEYDGTTKTHNLKISQSAKAGWCHHKEAYVGAYEGYDDGSYYKSAKDYIPTVSVTRETLRTKARANGYEDEYKWNIYTYEEHRAICHLFLVEYATRNSQAPVNTALTADGFKQGGLGSGCTTGIVKINGVDTYSFIPTGTTDSLGNGSGQVAYTVTQTDADGNEIDTVTRYANRYRGIENPFGHIWKHVDDIVNSYSSSTTNKEVFKCNKPEYFATNKNAKYKPLCSFSGGSKMSGWSKEIKATINCDFFKASAGGNESTYWCDYNYDNDDTSEHCLLIGGCSGNGGTAGLFGFSLDDGVGLSDVAVGSRLTYLPWA